MSRRRDAPPRRRRADLRVHVASAALLTALLAVIDARADPDEGPTELRLAWRAPSSCPPAAEIEAQFARLLGGPDRAASSRRVEAVATVRQLERGAWTVRIETTIDGNAGLRRLEGDSCWAVASATALLLALTIDPTAAGRAVLLGPDESSPVPPKEPPPPAESVAVPALAPRPRTSAPPPLRPFARAFGGGVADLLPQLAPLGGLAIGVRRAWLDVEISAAASGECRGLAIDRPTAGGAFRLFAVASRVCARMGTTFATAGLCAGGELERIVATGFGVDVPGSGAATLGAGVAAGVFALPLGSHVEASFELGVAARPYHPAFVIDRVGLVYTVPAVSSFAAAGLAVTF